MTYRGIVFDKDGTLLDFNRTWLPVYRFAAEEFAGGDAALALRLLTRHGFDSEYERFASGSLLAAGNNAQIAEAWARETNRLEQVESIGQRLHEIFRDQGAIQATPVKGLAETLNALKQSGFKLGVATADSHAGILNTLRSFAVLELFDFLAGYDSGHGVKPEAGMVRAFCAQLGIVAEQVVVVGDNRHDIEMGRSAGAGLCVGVLTGTSTRGDLESLADIVIEDISELASVLQRGDR